MALHEKLTSLAVGAANKANSLAKDAASKANTAIENGKLSLKINNEQKKIDEFTLNIGELIARVHAASRRAVVHADLVAGLAPREIAVDFLQRCGADGIISTRPLLIRRGRELGLLTVLRAFVIDSKAIESLAREAESAAPDVVEMLPAPMPRVVRRLAQSLRAPLIAGGLITDKEDVLAALSAGALCVSTSDEALWSI